ncbi:BON domain-containing protein [Variovorax sp. LARHSF232]
MKSDLNLKNDVMAELDWDPVARSTPVGVIVQDGVVTLTGHPASYAQKYAIERAAQRVKGVKALAVEMSVNLPGDLERTDAEIALAAERGLEWYVLVPDNKIRVMVEDGCVTLSGQVEWQYQRQAAEDSVRHLLGVRSLANQVVVRPKFTPADVEAKIESALQRQAQREARNIEILANGSRRAPRRSRVAWCSWRPTRLASSAASRCRSTAASTWPEEAFREVDP